MVAEQAVLPVTFGALDSEASWLQGGRTATEETRLGPHRLSGPYPTETTRPALFTALRTGFARELLREPFRDHPLFKGPPPGRVGPRRRRGGAGSASSWWWPPGGDPRPAQRPARRLEAAHVTTGYCCGRPLSPRPHAGVERSRTLEPAATGEECQRAVRPRAGAGEVTADFAVALGAVALA
jgi:hypothetical protein